MYARLYKNAVRLWNDVVLHSMALTKSHTITKTRSVDYVYTSDLVIIG